MAAWAVPAAGPFRRVGAATAASPTRRPAQPGGPGGLGSEPVPAGGPRRPARLRSGGTFGLCLGRKERIGCRALPGSGVIVWAGRGRLLRVLLAFFEGANGRGHVRSLAPFWVDDRGRVRVWAPRWVTIRRSRVVVGLPGPAMPAGAMLWSSREANNSGNLRLWSPGEDHDPGRARFLAPREDHIPRPRGRGRSRGALAARPGPAPVRSLLVVLHEVGAQDGDDVVGRGVGAVVLEQDRVVEAE